MAERDSQAVPGDRNGGGVAGTPAARGRATADIVDFVADLRQLRLHGLVAFRRLSFRALDGDPAEAERLLRSAVAALGPGNLGQAAGYTFGLALGTRDWPAQDRRRRAAEVYGVSIERFRKQQETIIVEQVAEQLLVLTSAAAPSAVREPWPDSPTPPAPAAPPAPSVPSFGDTIVFDSGTVPEAAPLTVHVLPIELMRGVDILVSTSNVYFEVSRIFGDTVCAGLRRAAARTDAAGRVTDDVVLREMNAWIAEHGGPGSAVAPGTVAATWPGALAERGVRRIYHAAVAVPVDHGQRYTVDDTSIVRAVQRVFATATEERDRYDPPLSSLCFPLIGAGRGGMDVDRSIGILWLALQEELRRAPHWSTHIAVQRPAVAARLLAHLAAEGANRRTPRSSPQE